MTKWSCRRIYKVCRSLYVIERSKKTSGVPFSLEMNVHLEFDEDGQTWSPVVSPLVSCLYSCKYPRSLTLTQTILIKLGGSLKDTRQAKKTIKVEGGVYQECEGGDRPTSGW